MSHEAWDRLATLLAEVLMRMGFEPAIRVAVKSAVQPMRGAIVSGPHARAERSGPAADTMIGTQPLCGRPQYLPPPAG